MVSRLLTGKWLGEVLAPSFHSDLEDLKTHWKAIKEFYIDRGELSSGAHITDHVHQMVKILLEERGKEEAEGRTPRGSTDTSPCMEYFLQEKILEVLCVLGEQNIPDGMLKVALMATSTLLRNMPVHIFHLMTVNHPISQMIVNCGGNLEPDEVDDYIDLIMTLFIVLTSDPSLIGFFLLATNEDVMDFVPFSGLLVYFNEEGSTGAKARQALLFCFKHLASERIVLDYLLNTSSCISLMVEEMVSRYRCLPQPRHEWSRKQLKDTPELHSFLTHCKFCSDLVEASPKAIREVFLSKLDGDFLTSVLGPGLLHTNEDVIATSSYYLSRMSTTLHGCMLESLVFFVLGDCTLAEQHEDGVGDNLLRSSIIRRINSCSDKCALASLGLFDTLIGLYDETIMFNLVLRNLAGLKHIEEEKRSTDLLKDFLERVRDVCEEYCSLYPASEAMADGLQAYMVDARNRVSQCKLACSTWKGDAARRVARHQDGSMDAPFFEGEFLRAIFDRLQSFLENSVAVNARLTSIISKMAGYPHPILHIYLVDPRVPVVSSTRTVYSILNSVSKVIRTHTREMSNLTEILRAVRGELNDDPSPIRPTELTKETRAIAVPALLLQEFCKEMASTVFFVWWNVYNVSEGS